ncbi:melanoma cell adhesion molecule b [Brachyhypopomus gauderio]|uniref:melanoma cell adhesion molecule b n=1 Tax=Brachyhypopomus gauderio TaxID=698409 RepID=UPI004042719D
MAQRKVPLALAGLCVLVLQAWAQLDISMEDRVEGLLGETAEIPCIYNTSQPLGSLTLQWFVRAPGSKHREQIYYKDKNGESVTANTDYTDRIRVSNAIDSTVGNSILTITGLRIKDEQEVVCEVHGNTDIKEGHTNLLVFNTPTPPSVIKGSYTSTEKEEKEEIASCEVNNAYPAPNITWYKNSTPLHPAFHNMKMENALTTNPSGLITAHSVLFLQVVKEDKEALFYCEVSYFTPGGTNMMESELFNIEVHYPTTQVTIRRENPTELVKEGDSVEFICEGDGSPQPIFIFEHNNEPLEAESGFLFLENVMRSNSGVYKCMSLDGLDSTNSLELMVNYLDPVVITPEDSPHMVIQGQDVSLTCNALSSLPTHTRWYQDGSVLEDSHTLNLHNLSYDMSGSYGCEVYVPSLPELKRQNSVLIIVTGKPELVQEVAMTLLDGEGLVNLNCSAIGHPTPNITWNISHNQTILDEWITRTDYTILSVITVSVTADFTASCVVVNELGSAEASRHITASEIRRPAATTAPPTTTTTTTSTGATKDTKEGSGVIIAVIIILILLLAILGSVLYFLYKKGKIPCGRSGKQDLTKEKSSKDDVVVEMKSSRSEEAVLLQGVNGEKKSPSGQ